MSNPDSFLDEVADEVRRDRLNLMVRRYGWIVALAVLALVAAVGAWEWRQSAERAAAERFGDALIAALSSGTPNSRALALSEVQADSPERQALAGLLRAGELAAANSRDAAEVLRALMDDAQLPALYRDAARLKLVTLPEPVLTTSERLTMLETLTVPGNPLRMTAVELTAMVYLERNDTAAAAEALTSVMQSAEASATQKSRAQQLLVVLGQPVEAG